MPGHDKMNTHLTIRPVFAAAAFVAVIGISALSVAQADEAGAQRVTIGAGGPPEPRPFVDCDNTWLTSTATWNAARALVGR
jgi:hypothetical protein